MKKFFGYFFVVAAGAIGVYFCLCKMNKINKQTDVIESTSEIKEEKVVVPSRDDFINEATKLQVLAENKNGNSTCTCYNVKELDPNSKLKGSILVYTSGDIYLSNMWLSNGYYIIEDSEIVTSGLVEESDKEASIYCGESSSDVQPSLCSVD